MKSEMSGVALPDASPISVVLPLLTLVPGGMGGSETYVRELCRELRNRDDVAIKTLASSTGAQASGGTAIIAKRVKGGSSTAGRLSTLVAGNLPDRQMRRALRTADVVHFPLSVPVPRPGTAPMVQTLLDMQHADLCELFSRAEIAYRKVAYDRPARRADRVITISEFSKGRIVERLGVPAERIAVAHLGVDPSSFTAFLGQREQFVFYPARSWPHKNHARLIDAMGRVRERGHGLRLVLTGSDPTGLGPLPEWVEHRGLVSRRELQDLYRTAACLVFPSRYEGFGLPPLEAMASGCPVAAASAGSLPEICGDAAVMFSPDDVDGMAHAIVTAIDGRDRLVPLGLERIRQFSWRACADAHVSVYRELAERHRNPLM